MNIGLILASGYGKRIKSIDKPKQFFEINKKPIIIYTIEKFINNKNIDLIVVTCQKEWQEYLSKSINKYFNTDKIYIIEGSTSRNKSILNGINFLDTSFNLEDNDIIITHDGVRPFINDDIINKNILSCKENKAVTTAIGAIDTIALSEDQEKIAKIMNRNQLINIQTPQTFNFNIIRNAYFSNSSYKFFDSTDACEIVMLDNNKISIVYGSRDNFKITYDFDLNLAKYFIDKNNKAK